VLTRSIVPPGLGSVEIDSLVAEALRNGQSLYQLDGKLLEELRPDVVITQELCDVCAVDHAVVAKTVAQISSQPELISLQPDSIGEVLGDVLRVGDALGARVAAQELVLSAEERLDRIRGLVDGLVRPRVLALEWYDPPYFGGHWVPEQIEMAGGISVLGTPRERSGRVPWRTIHQLEPEVILLMPCGYNLSGTRSLLRELESIPEWRELSVVQQGNVWALDANACFSRPAPRVVLGVEVVAHILHPSEVPAPLGAALWEHVGHPGANT
jgi:iron complex transport system substrate-binding protein